MMADTAVYPPDDEAHTTIFLRVDAPFGCVPAQPPDGGSGVADRLDRREAFVLSGPAFDADRDISLRGEVRGVVLEIRRRIRRLAEGAADKEQHRRPVHSAGVRLEHEKPELPPADHLVDGFLHGEDEGVVAHGHGHHLDGFFGISVILEDGSGYCQRAGA